MSVAKHPVTVYIYTLKLHLLSAVSIYIITVFKHKDQDSRGGATRGGGGGGGDSGGKESEKKVAAEPAYIPVVGENEPELKPSGPTKRDRKRLDPGQLATDDFHYDKYKKRSRHY